MSAFVGSYRDEMDACYAADFGRDREPMKKQSRRPEYRRSGSSPTRVNGMHCRRNKRWTWGSGRGARMTNMRAFASCVAWALASAASTAFAGTYVTVNNAGNAANPANGIGAVSTVYRMSNAETTNAEYVSFLNTVATVSDPFGLYDARMTSSINGGILRSGSAGSFSYALKTDVVTRGAMPVNFVNWFDAARYVNWLQTGNTEAGAYTLTGQTSGPIPARNAGAQYWLPSQNEWFKAAFYSPTGTNYNTWGTGGNTKPTATTANTNPASNYDQVVNGGSTTSIGLNSATHYSASLSAYGLYNMMGSVWEMIDNGSSAGTSAFNTFGGSWRTTDANMNLYASNLAVPYYVGFTTSTANDSVGFRVAAAVPEPGTIALAATGILGAAGAGWLKRRKRQAAVAAAGALAG
jgi:sulfatase modifying factor 1